MFCDELQIKLIAGSGGNGCMSFRREKFVPKGGPDGGDGGKGGDIIIKVDPNLNTLSHLAHQKTYKADSGEHGKGKKMYGRGGSPMVLHVPKGTLIMTADRKQLLADLNKENEEMVIARGGKGGLGNTHFVSSTYQAPRFAETGEPGEEKEVILELKLVADVGIIGKPSAGKSTLISVISNAKPKIADYHFTTLIPNLGMVDMSRFGGQNEENFVVADIPGLIEGASQGKGLGHQFLKHVTRTKILVHLIDGYEEDWSNNYKTIRNELKSFDKRLMKTEELVAINKIDLLQKEELEKKLKKFKRTVKDKKIICISAAAHINLKELIFEITKTLGKLKKQSGKVVKNKIIPIIQPKIQESFSIEKIIQKKTHKIFRIAGKRIEQLVVMTDIRNPEGLERVYHFFNKMGIQKAIERKGAEVGDIIKIKEKNIPYRR